MHATPLSRLLLCFIFNTLILCTTQTQSIIGFEPSYIDVTVGKTRSVTVRLLVPDIVPPDLLIEFLYDNKRYDPDGFVDTLPNITFSKQPSGDSSRVILITGRHHGHVVITPLSSQVNISTQYDYLLVDIARSKILSVFIGIFGWIYFFAWSISFYPQIILNFRRQSVVGLNFDFLALNLLGHTCYSIFNICLYTSYDIQQQYYAKHPHGILPVLLNDVLFSVHAVIACLVTAGQCVFFERGKQSMSHLGRLTGIGLVIFLFVSTIVAFTNHLATLTLLYFYSYVKLAITIIKYVPQAWMNYKRKSTEGWSIGNILLDFTGGTFSILQMFLLASNYNDWSSIFGSPTKFGLGVFSILFDCLFIVQHYILYRTHTTFSSIERTVTQDISDENTPILTNS